MIAMAVACQPKVLVADEPTTALDVTVQAGILDVLRDLRDRLGTSILVITHDLGVIADVADRVVSCTPAAWSSGPVSTTCSPARSTTYTAGLLSASPRPGRHAGRDRLNEIPGLVPVLAASPTPAPSPSAARPPTTVPVRGRRWRRRPADAGGRDHHVACWHPSVPGHGRQLVRRARASDERPARRRAGGGRGLEMEDLAMHFGPVRAVDGVSLTVRAGPVMAWSARAVPASPPSAGASCACWNRPRARSGSPAPTSPTCPAGRLRPHRRESPSSSRTRPARWTRGCWWATRGGAAAARRAGSPAGTRGPGSPRHSAGSGCGAEVARRYPHELSGGQRQRVSIARALVPTPAAGGRRADQRARRLGAGVGAQPAGGPAARHGFRLPVHHPRPVRGRVPRRRRRRDVPRPARRTRLAANGSSPVPRTPTPRRCCPRPRSPTRSRQRARQAVLLGDDLPSALDPPSGCRFHTRCPLAFDRCATEVPGAAADRRRHGRLPPGPPTAPGPTSAPPTTQGATA